MPERSPDSRYNLFRIASAVLLFAFAVAYGFQCVKNGRMSAPPKVASAASKKEKLGNDFTAFYSAGEQARLGRNIYDWQSTSMPHRPFEYPPLFAIFPMMLLSYFSYNTALALFYAINAVLLAASFLMLRRLLWPSGIPPAAWQWPLVGIWAALVLSWRFIHSNTNESNANLYMLFLLTLAFFCNEYLNSKSSETPRAGVLCGIWVAMATAIKLTPGLFGVYFLWSRRGWSMVGGALGLIFFLLIVPGIFLGWSTNLKYLDAYKFFALGKTTGTETGESAENSDPERIIIGRPRQLDPNESNSAQGVGVSLRGVLISLLTPSPALRKSGDRPRTVNIATLDLKAVGRIANILSLIVLLTTIALTFSASSRLGTQTAALSWSLVIITMTLISPLTRIAHLVVLAFPIATLVALIQQQMLKGTAKVLVPTALVLLIASSATGEYLHAIGFTTFALLVLYAAVAVTLVSMKNRGNSEEVS